MPAELLDIREFNKRKDIASPEILIELLKQIQPKDLSVEQTRLANNLQSISKPKTTTNEAANYINLLKQDKRNTQEPIYTKNSARFKDGTAIDAEPPKPQTDSGSMELAMLVLSLLGGPGAIKTLGSKLGWGNVAGLGGSIPALSGLLNSGVDKLGQTMSNPSNPAATGWEMLSKNPPTLR